MNLYSKNQIGIIFIIILGIFYSQYLDKKYYDTINNGIVFKSMVIKQNCNHSFKMSSSVWIKENYKVYTVKLEKKSCNKYPVNTKIEVFYSKSNDEFIFKVKEYHGNNRLIFLCTLLLISFLPWSFWITKLENRNKKKLN